MPITHANCDVCRESYPAEELDTLESSVLGVEFSVCPNCNLDSINRAESRAMFGGE